MPLSQPRSDGWTNLLDSLFVAGLVNYAGVGVVFAHQVLVGCRQVQQPQGMMELTTYKSHEDVA